MMRSISLIFLLMLMLLVPFTSIAQSNESSANILYQQAQRSYFQLKSNPDDIGNPSAWTKVLNTYQLIIASYPNDPMVDDITFVTGAVLREMYQQFGKRLYLDHAIEQYRTILRDYPQSYLQQAALFAVADIQESHLKSPRDALDSYVELVSRYPKGYKTTAAKERIKSLEKDLGVKVSLPESKPRKKLAENNGNPAISNAIDASKKQYYDKASITTTTQSPTVDPKAEANKILGSKSKKGGQAKITDIRVSFNPKSGAGRVTIELDREIQYSYQQLPAPNRRILIDLHSVVLAKSDITSNSIPIKNNYLKQIRLGQFKPTVTRVVFDFSSFKNYKIWPLPGPNDHHRIVFDLFGAGRGPTYLSASKEAGNNKASRPETSNGKLPDGASKNANGKYSLSRQFGLKTRTIVIDPGHGGRDPGAIGFSKLTEAKLNLDVAKRLKAIFEKEYPEITVKLTRETNKFVSLDQRPAKSNVWEGDIFVSLHSNATRRGRASGIETYYLNFTTDKDAIELAAKENALSRLNQAKLGDLVKKITKESKKEESRELAQFIQTHLYRQAKPVNPAARNLGVKHAPFVVLIGTNVPSVLVEIGFINHKTEGKLLLTSSYRNRIARGLFNGIKAYIQSTE